jgi:hypothetical protein
MTNQDIITQIGSLPYDNISKAIEYSLKHDIPFLPELPKRGDLMTDYIKHPGKMSCLEEFITATKGYDAVKIQCIGPASIISVTNRKFEEEKSIDVTSTHIIKIANSLDAKKIILFLDEPTLETAGYDYAKDGMTKEVYESMGFIAVDYKRAWENLVERLKAGTDYSKIKLGVHTCGNFDWKTLSEIKCIDIISFDTSEYAKVFDAQNFYSHKKNVAWGIKTSDDIQNIQNMPIFVYGDLITPPCGLANQDIYECEKTLTMLKATKENIIEKYGLTRFIASQ